MSLILTSVGSTSASYRIYDLPSTWNASNYSQACITRLPASPNGSPTVSALNYFDGSFIYPTSFGFESQTPVSPIPDLTPSTSYGTVYAALQKRDGKWYYGGSATLGTTSGGSGGSGVPTGYLGLQVSSPINGSNARQFFLSWSAASGSGVSYEIYTKLTSDMSDSQFSLYTTITGTSLFVNVSSWNTYYDFKVRAKNSSGYGSEDIVRRVQSADANTPPPPTNIPVYDNSNGGVPFAYYPSAPQNNDWKISVGFGGLGNEASYYIVYFNDNMGSGDVEKWRGVYGACKGIIVDRQGHKYTIRVRACNNYGCSVGYSEGTFTTRGTARPALWNWTNPKTQGTSFNLTASEWNSFTDNINAMRAYYDIIHPSATIGQYSFTTAPFDTSRKFYAWMYNQAVTSINHMSPPTAIPSDTASSKVAGQSILAKYFNDLKASLNSI